MKPLTIPRGAKNVPIFLPALMSGSMVPLTTRKNKRSPRPSIPALLFDPGPFAVALAHEVRNPLANINLSVEMLTAAINNNDQQLYLDIIMRSSTRINNLIHELLTPRRADEAQVETCSMYQLLDEVLDMTKDRILLKNISVRRAYGAPDCQLVLNKSKMKIALTNIFINAIDAMLPGIGELKLVTKFGAGKYIVQIEDNGCGISPANMKLIFKPYFTNKPGGLGLGLATTADILRSNQVKVIVESTEGTGTRFLLLFEKKIAI